MPSHIERIDELIDLLESDGEAVESEILAFGEKSVGPVVSALKRRDPYHEKRDFKRRLIRLLQSLRATQALDQLLFLVDDLYLGKAARDAITDLASAEKLDMMLSHLPTAYPSGSRFLVAAIERVLSSNASECEMTALEKATALDDMEFGASIFDEYSPKDHVSCEGMRQLARKELERRDR